MRGVATAQECVYYGYNSPNSPLIVADGQTGTALFEFATKTSVWAAITLCLLDLTVLPIGAGRFHVKERPSSDCCVRERRRLPGRASNGRQVERPIRRKALTTCRSPLNISPLASSFNMRLSVLRRLERQRDDHGSRLRRQAPVHLSRRPCASV